MSTDGSIKEYSVIVGRDGTGKRWGKGVFVCLLHTYDLLQAKTNLTAKAQKYYKKEPKIKKIDLN